MSCRRRRSDLVSHCHLQEPWTTSRPDCEQRVHSRGWRLSLSSCARVVLACHSLKTEFACTLATHLSDLFFRMAFATWYIGVTPVPPASMPAAGACSASARHQHCDACMQMTEAGSTAVLHWKASVSASNLRLPPTRSGVSRKAFFPLAALTHLYLSASPSGRCSAPWAP